jgi:hypothetical protein
MDVRSQDTDSATDFFSGAVGWHFGIDHTSRRKAT